MKGFLVYSTNVLGSSRVKSVAAILRNKFSAATIFLSTKAFVSSKRPDHTYAETEQVTSTKLEKIVLLYQHIKSLNIHLI